MNALLLEPAGAPAPATLNVRERDPRGGPTLDELITGVWEGLAVRLARPVSGVWRDDEVPPRFRTRNARRRVRRLRERADLAAGRFHGAHDAAPAAAGPHDAARRRGSASQQARRALRSTGRPGSRGG